MTSKQSDFLKFMEYFVNDYMPVIAGFSKNTIKSYKDTFKLFFKYMQSENQLSPDQITFQKITPQIMLGFMKWLKTVRKCCSSTLQQRLAAFLTFSEYAQNRNFDAACSFRNSVLSVPRRNCSQNHKSFFTVQEIEVLLKTPDDSTNLGYRDFMILSFMYASGTRAQEVCDLKVESVLFGRESTVVVVHGKGNKTRRILISSTCSMQLQKYLKSKKLINRPDSFLFTDRKGGQLTINCLEKLYKKYVLKAKLSYPTMFNEDSYSPHSMRHSTASHMLDAGVPLTVIKNFLGHSSLQTTQIYAEMSANKANKFLLEWNEKWFPKLPDQNQKEKEENEIPDFLKD